MASSEKFCLKWNDFETNISSAFRDLREEKDFFDVTLASDDDNQIQAHKVILSACSPFFRNILRRNSHQHPMLYLKGVKYKELISVLNFMYMGEVSVAQEELNSFLSVAEELKVKGLTQNKQPDAVPKIKPKQIEKPPDQAPPPPKRPRVTPSTPVPMKRSIPAPSYTQDDEIEEYIPVKTEPREPLPQPIIIQPAPTQFQNQEDYQTQDQEMVQEAGNEQGTVALDDGYAVDESYDYQYAGEAYPNNSGVATNDDTNKGKKSLRVKEKVTKPKPVKKEKPRVPIKVVGNGYSQAWQCEICQKISSSRKNAVAHIEEDH